MRYIDVLHTSHSNKVQGRRATISCKKGQDEKTGDDEDAARTAIAGDTNAGDTNGVTESSFIQCADEANVIVHNVGMKQKKAEADSFHVAPT